MATATHTATRLAYDDEGAGTPAVLLHGLTFDRRSWRPIIERLGGAVRSIAIDLPAHGDSRGAPVPVEQVPARLHELLNALAVERPVVVGHSMSGACTTRPRTGSPRTSFSAVRRLSASRTGVRLTPNCSPRWISTRRVPGGISPERIICRSWR
jgi:alpha-beta hydrolase superfamily lysophospholipase